MWIVKDAEQIFWLISRYSQVFVVFVSIKWFCIFVNDFVISGYFAEVQLTQPTCL